jgi:hypothetical protein
MDKDISRYLSKFGAKGGRSTSEIKKKAAIGNGKNGGRPPKGGIKKKELTLRDHLSMAGSVVSEKKKISSVKNAKSGKGFHFLKTEHFENIFPYKLINNEYLHKMNIVIHGFKTTYNPDYYCPELKCYIEVATSTSNITMQGMKWKQAIKNNEPLKIYWWAGNEITNDIMEKEFYPSPKLLKQKAARENGKKGGAPKGNKNASKKKGGSNGRNIKHN